MDHRNRLTFHLTGRGLETLEGRALQPALFARYRDLAGLRYDYPLVLGSQGIRPLSRVVDLALQEAAPPGPEGEDLRKAALRVEREIRRAGPRGRLLEWFMAEDVAAVRAVLEDGELVPFGARMPRRVVEHLWKLGQRRRGEVAGAALDRRIAGLSDLLRAESARSLAGCTAGRLEASFGTAHRGSFDFDAMARLLSRGGEGFGFTEERRGRIQHTLDSLEARRSLACPDPSSLVFDAPQAALDALRYRLPGMLELVKATAVADLELQGRYVEAEHDAFFAAFDRRALGLEDLLKLPSSLVCVERMGPGDAEVLMELLASGLPVKVLACCDDLLAESPLGDGTLAPGYRTARLASAALGLGEAFVVQASASQLVQALPFVEEGLSVAGPAFFSVFAPPAGYMLAAAAAESRAFPFFAWDGASLDLSLNPQMEEEWPVHRLEYEDRELQRVVEPLPFTALDFLAADRRYAGQFAAVSSGDGLLPAVEALSGEEGVPLVRMVDETDRLVAVVPTEAVVRASRRFAAAWKRLRDLAEETAEDWPFEELPPVPAPTPSAAAEAITAPAAAEPAGERDPDEPWIQTPRCSSCNECININPRMFAYDANKQAYLADVTAGTYRQLVEAAESCQVSIIHPGKPRNLDEPRLEELLRRAEPFMA